MTSEVRNDFAKLDDYSYEQCLKILENYEAARTDIQKFLAQVDPNVISEETLDALDAIFVKFGAKNKDAQLRRAIIKQIRKEIES